MNQLLLKSLLLLGVAALSACGGGNDRESLMPPTTPTTTVSGVAAVGAAISGAQIGLRCAGGLSRSATSASNGAWSAAVPSASLPCAVQVSGGTVAGVGNGTVFYSIARAGSGTASTANLTPISDLALASAVNSVLGTAVSSWYSGATDAQRQQVADALAAAIGGLRTALTDAGYSLPNGSFDPFTAAITAGAATDAYDQLLEAYRQALERTSRSYENARGDYVAGGSLPTPQQEPVGESPDTTLGSGESGARFATTGKVLGNNEKNQLRTWNGTGSITSGSTAGTLSEVTLNGPEANSYLNFRNLPDAVGTHDCGYGFNDNKANIELGFAAGNGYNSMGTRGANGSYTTGFRCSITITQVGTRKGSAYEGTIEGSFDAQLYKTGQAVNRADSISVNGHFRLGAPAVTEPEPEPATAKSLLGAMLKNVIAGDYVLKCSASPGQAVQSFDFSVKADGSSLFQGQPLVDATHPGSIKSDGDQTSFITLAFTPTASDSDYVVLGFKKDGSFYPSSVHVAGSTLSCYSNTGHSAPAASAQAVASIPGVAGALARTETLRCTQGTTTAPQTLTIASDGSAQLGTQMFAASKLFTITDGLLFGTVRKGTLSYSDVGGGAYRSLAIDFDADLKTTGVLAAVGLGPSDGISCTP